METIFFPPPPDAVSVIPPLSLSSPHLANTEEGGGRGGGGRGGGRGGGGGGGGQRRRKKMLLVSVFPSTPFSPLTQQRGGDGFQAREPNLDPPPNIDLTGGPPKGKKGNEQAPAPQPHIKKAEGI